MKRIPITVCLIFTFVILEAKNPPKRYIYPEWGFYLEGSGGYSFISNPNIPSDIWDVKGNLGTTFYAGYFRSLNPNFRIKAGIGASYFTSSLLGNGVAPQKEFKDIDGDTYLETLTIMNSETRQKPIYFSVPLVLEYGNVSVTRLGYYVDLGMKYSYMINNNTQSDGYYSTTGTYEQWGVTLEDINELGFYSEKDLESNTNFKNSDLAVLGGVGITLPVSSVIIFKLGVVANLGILDIGNNKSKKPNDSPLSTETFNFRSPYIDNTLAVTKGTKTRYFGLELGVYINKQVK